MKNFKWTLGLLIVASSAQAAIPPADFNVNSGRSLRAQVDTYAEVLEKEVARAKTNKDKFRALNRVIDEIKVVRENGMPQSAHDEAYMDLMVAVFESLPSEKDFKKRDCSRYENDMLNQFEPVADDSPSEPAVKPGWNVLSSLCR